MADGRGLWSVLFVVLLAESCSQLVVNVKTREGDTAQQRILANKESDNVILDYHMPDGSYAAMVVDFQRRIQVFKSVVLGELELGQKPYEAMCFLLYFDGNDFIPSDAMAKLRQKNPQTVRVAEEDLGSEKYLMDKAVSPADIHRFGSIVQETCSDVSRIYTTSENINLMAKGNETLLSELISASINMTIHGSERSCLNVTDNWEDCLCEHLVCIQWYPCALKYCQGQNDRGRIINYRCGIRSCAKCRVFNLRVKYKHQCFWETLIT